MSAVLKTLLISDLVDSTKLIETLGDEVAFNLFSKHDRLARDLLTPNKGLEIDKTDGFLILFERPYDAVCYAMSYHAGLDQLSQKMGHCISARVGIHFGEVFLRENPKEDVLKGAKPLEVEGLAKPAAARLMSVALPGQTLLMRGAFDLARRAAVGQEKISGELVWMAHGPYFFKGIDEAIDVFEVGIVDVSPLKAPVDSAKVKKVVGTDTLEGWRPGRGLPVPHRANWVLSDKLGEGGFGEVWLGNHQKTGDQRVYKFCFEKERIKGLQREVTLFRLLKTALGSRNDIARIIDWNFDDAPYFLEIEYTEGGSLLDWSKEKGGIQTIPLKDRFSIFVQVANALAAAHSVGVLHKDIKPANILMTIQEDKLQAKLTDFGIGLVTDSKKLEDAGITVLGFTENWTTSATSGAGTLQYMAPELQIGGLGTVKADIYALGVLLYQLAVGDFQAALAPGWRRKLDDDILADDISQATDGALDLRLGDAGELARNILNLEKRREERERLAFEKEEVARAKRELLKSQKRKRVFSIAALVLLVFSIVMVMQSRRIAKSAARANLEAETANRVSDFLVDLFEVEEGKHGATVTGQELLDRGTRNIESTLLEQPLLRARMLENMGKAYLNLGLYKRAETHLSEAVELFNKTVGIHDIHSITSSAFLGYLYGLKGDYEASHELLSGALLNQTGHHSGQKFLRRKILEFQVEIMRREGLFAQAQPLEDELLRLPKHAKNVGETQSNNQAENNDIVELKQLITLPTKTIDVVPSMRYAGMALATSSTGVYLLDLAKKRPPDFIPNKVGEHIVGSLFDGRVGFRNGATLLFRDLLTRRTQKDLLIFDDLKPDEKVYFDRLGRVFCRLSPGNIQLYRYVKGDMIRSRSFEIPSGPMHYFTVSYQFAAWVLGTTPYLLNFDTGELIEIKTKIEGSIECIAFEENFNMMALAGWFDEIYIFNLPSGELKCTVEFKGRTHSLDFIGDRPTLAIGKSGRLGFWREGEDVFWEMERAEARFLIGGMGADGFFVHDFIGQDLSIFDYYSVKVVKKIQVSAKPLWTSVADQSENCYYFGGADGVLHRYDLKPGNIRSETGHSQGITSMVMIDGKVVTGSDDKFIAIWDSYALKVQSRRKAHESLVNFMVYDRPSELLWSSSSDHTIKAWSWPGLEKKQQITIPKGTVAGFWIDNSAGYGFAGEWSREVQFLVKDAGKWKVNETTVLDSICLYGTVHLPELEGVFGLALGFSQLLYYHIPSQNLYHISLPEFLFSGITKTSEKGLLLMGLNTCMFFDFSLDESTLSYQAQQGFNTQFRELGCGSYLTSEGLAAVGNSLGEVFFIKKHDLPPEAVLKGQVKLN